MQQCRMLKSTWQRPWWHLPMHAVMPAPPAVLTLLPPCVEAREELIRDTAAWSETEERCSLLLSDM